MFLLSDLFVLIFFYHCSFLSIFLPLPSFSLYLSISLYFRPSLSSFFASLLFVSPSLFSLCLSLPPSRRISLSLHLPIFLPISLSIYLSPYLSLSIFLPPLHFFSFYLTFFLFSLSPSIDTIELHFYL